MQKVGNGKEGKDAANAGLPSLSRKEYLILEMLIQIRRELFGLEMVEASRGKLKRGTIYVTLQRMQEKGLVDSKPEPRTAPEIGIPRRLYRVSGYGERVYRAYQVAQSVFVSSLSTVPG